MLRYREIYKRMYVDTSRTNMEPSARSAQLTQAYKDPKNYATIQPSVTPSVRKSKGDAAMRELSNSTAAATMAHKTPN